MSRDIVTKVVDDFTPAYHTEEVVQFILQDARKVFGVLSLISQVGYINRFIRNDQYQARCIDDLLPFTKKRLQEILNDDYVAELFYEKQWEFSVPVFSGRIIPRVLERETILPFFADNHLAGGCHGSVQKIEIHPSYRPQRFETTKIVSIFSNSKEFLLLIVVSSSGKSWSLTMTPTKMKYVYYQLFSV